jgi:hypothetical protein
MWRDADLFSQLTPGFRPGSLFGQSPAPTSEPEALKDSEAPAVHEAPKDILDLSRVASDLPSASFDWVGALAPPPVAVAGDGTYRPTQVQHLLSTSLNFSFSLGSFMADVQAAFALNDAETDDFVAMVANEVGAFFDEIDSFLAEARGAL